MTENENFSRIKKTSVFLYRFNILNYGTYWKEYVVHFVYFVMYDIW
jgi:hypothetical protein